MATSTATPIPCNASSPPTCGGVCPTGESCLTNLFGLFGCGCIGPCASATAPTCYGLCPLGIICTNQNGTCVCPTPPPTPTPTPPPPTPTPTPLCLSHQHPCPPTPLPGNIYQCCHNINNPGCKPPPYNLAESWCGIPTPATPTPTPIDKGCCDPSKPCLSDEFCDTTVGFPCICAKPCKCSVQYTTHNCCPTGFENATCGGSCGLNSGKTCTKVPSSCWSAPLWLPGCSCCDSNGNNCDPPPTPKPCGCTGSASSCLSPTGYCPQANCTCGGDCPSGKTCSVWAYDNAPSVTYCGCK